MKTLYLDCNMGAAGDMLTAALLELLPAPDNFVAELNSLGIPDVEFVLEKSVKCGITGTHVSVKISGIEEWQEHHHESEHRHHHHRSMADIVAVIDSLNIIEKVKTDVLTVYKLILIADVESHAHDVPVSAQN